MPLFAGSGLISEISSIGAAAASAANGAHQLDRKTDGRSEDGLRVVIAVTKIGPGGVPPQLYAMLIDGDGGSMSPELELSECFEEGGLPGSNR